MKSLWRVVTYLLKNVEHGIEHDILIELMLSLHILDIHEIYSRFSE